MLHTTPVQVVSAVLTGDAIYGGIGSIPGTVVQDALPSDLPLRRRVRLHRDVNGEMIRETWSDAITGAYLFQDLDPAYKYTVVAYDHTHTYRPEAISNITPDV